VRIAASWIDAWCTGNSHQPSIGRLSTAALGRIRQRAVIVQQEVVFLDWWCESRR